MIKGLVIAAIVIYAAALVGYAAAWIAESVLSATSQKEIAAKIKSGFLFVVCLPYWLYKRFKK